MGRRRPTHQHGGDQPAHRARQRADHARQQRRGRTVAGTTKYVANVFVNYTFTDGRLKGFSAGGGVSRTGRQYSTIIRNETYYRAARDNTSLALSYSTKLRNVPTRFALNINNVLDDTDPIVTSYDGSWRDASGRAIANGFSLPSRRLSSRLDSR